MIKAENLCSLLKEHGFNPYTGVPCSILKPIVNYIIDSPNMTYLIASSEGEAMGIAAGISLAGKKPVVMMQNSGLGNAVNPLTSLQLIYDLPVLLLVTLRGEPGRPDEPQHKIMGKITPDLLGIMDIYYEYLVETEQELGPQISRVCQKIEKEDRPAALIIRKGVVGDYELKRREDQGPEIVLRRKEAIRCIVESLNGDEAVISTTGKISRELYYHGKEGETNFYVVGSMGCAGSIGFGIACQKPDRKVVVLDGDGAVLMKMGTLATIGYYRPPNYIHIVLDNGCHDSTGGQPTVSKTTRLEKIALNAGYLSSRKIYGADELKEAVREALGSGGPHFILIKVLRGADKDLGRPELTPLQVKDRFMEFLK